MTEQIVSQADVERRARKAFAAGEDVTANPFPWHSAAHATWEAEWKRLSAQRAHHAQRSTVPPTGHGAVDLAQSFV